MAAGRWMGFGVLAVLSLSACGGEAGGRGEADGGDPLAVCEGQLRRAPAARSSMRCFFEAARGSPETTVLARRRLEELLGSSPENAWAHFYLAGLLWRAQDRPGAEREYRQAARLFAERGDAASEIDARTSLIRLLRPTAADPSRLEAELESLQRVAKAGGEAVLRARADIELANHLLVQSRDLERAFDILRAGEEAIQQSRDRPYYRGRWLEAMVKTSFSLDRQRITQRYLHDWKAFLAQDRKDSKELATARYVELAIYVTLAPPSERSRQLAVELAREAAEAAKRSRSLPEYVQTLRILGMLQGGEEGRADLEEAVSLSGGGRIPPEVSRLCRASLVRSLVGDRPAEARRRMEGILREAREVPESWSLLFAFDEAVRVAWKTRPREEALELGREGLDSIEGLRIRQGGGIARAGVFAVWMGLFERQAGRFLAGGDGGPGREDLRRAFDVLERKRARVLLEALEASGARRSEPGSFPSLDRIEAQLEEDEALLSFQLAYDEDLFGEFAGGSWLLASTRAGTRAYRLPDLLELGDSLSGLLDLDDPEGDPHLLAYLHGQLLGRAFEDLPDGVRRLLVVPDGALHRLPFAALRGTVQGPPLVERFELATVPSATLWWRWRQREGAGGRSSTLVLADPDLGDLEPPDSGGAWALGPPQRLGRLPYAALEGRSVLKHLGGGSRLLEGREASEHHLKELLGRGHFHNLHFGAHARVDEWHPEASAIYLRPGAGEDGLLHPAEIVELELPGGLVVLAACSSAAGETLRGEGTLSLARYFFEAGVDVVLGSLKPLPDREAAGLFEAFYLELGRGKNVAAALAAAQQKSRSEGVSAHVWANVVVFGDGSLVLRPAAVIPERRRHSPNPAPLPGAGLPR